MSVKGVVLAGGTGSRLRPMTNVVNKHILPVYDKPVIYYPVETLIESGIDDIMVISTPDDIGRYIRLLEEDYEAGFRYRVQKEPKGIADALSLASDFVTDNVVVMLGDNIILDNLSEEFDKFQATDSSAKIFLKQVDKPARYGVAKIEEGNITSLVEKPENPKSNYAVTGLYMYNSKVFDIIDSLEPSDRGELEITDANEELLDRESLDFELIDSKWFDVGTPEGLFQASKYVRSQK